MVYGNDLPLKGIGVVTISLMPICPTTILIGVVSSCITAVVISSDGNDTQSEMNDWRMEHKVQFASRKL